MPWEKRTRNELGISFFGSLIRIRFSEREREREGESNSNFFVELATPEFWRILDGFRDGFELNLFHHDLLTLVKI